MNDLRLLLQVDPHKKVISLEFKQITSLEPMMPLLEKFQSLSSLSLHGNRLKQLPRTMDRLESLHELDISNNLFHQIEEVITSLKTLPNLAHLLYSFRSKEEEDYLRTQLPKLERINKKPVTMKNQNLATSHRRRKDTMKLTQQDLEEVGLIYDEIRDIYKQSKYMMDKELAQDFDKNVEAIMADLKQKLGRGGSDTSVNSSIVCCKYSLLDICFVKLITYFYHFDKKMAVNLEKIHDYQAQLFKQLTNIVSNQVERGKIQLANVSLKKQELYLKEIKRLKAYEFEVQKQVEQLQIKNKQIVDRMVKIGKSDILETTIGGEFGKSRVLNSQSKANVNALSPHSHSKNKSAIKYPLSQRSFSEMVTVPSGQKSLTLHQLKQIICQIMTSKQKHNQVCRDTGHVMETTEAHMYTYLNQKYGLKNITVEWAMNIVNGIRKFGPEDAEVAVFGKILRNQLDQHFFHTIRRQKFTLKSEIVKFRSISPSKQENAFEDNLITVHEAEQILLNMQLKRQSITQILEKVKDDYMVNNCLTPESLQKILMAYLLRVHSERLTHLRLLFKEADTDQDGVIDTDQLNLIAQKAKKGIQFEELNNTMDPHQTSVITFSHFAQCIFYNPELKQFFDVQQKY